LVKKIRFGTMSLPNSHCPPQRILTVKNAQSNTLLCKGNMNFRLEPRNFSEGRKWEDG
jgi:hypothetical protein